MLESHSRFREKERDKIISQGGAITTDGVTLEVQNRHFYDFAVHHFNVQKPRTLTESPLFSIQTSTILLVEGPGVPNAVNLSTDLNEKSGQRLRCQIWYRSEVLHVCNRWRRSDGKGR